MHAHLASFPPALCGWRIAALGNRTPFACPHGGQRGPARAVASRGGEVSLHEGLVVAALGVQHYAPARAPPVRSVAVDRRTGRKPSWISRKCRYHTGYN